MGTRCGGPAVQTQLGKGLHLFAEGRAALQGFAGNFGRLAVPGASAAPANRGPGASPGPCREATCMSAASGSVFGHDFIASLQKAWGCFLCRL